MLSLSSLTMQIFARVFGFALFSSALLLGRPSQAQTLYLEDFTGQNGQGAVGPGPTIDLTGVDWTLDLDPSVALTATTDYAQVVNEVFEVRDTNADAGLGVAWLSPTIDISTGTNLWLSLDAAGTGDFEASGAGTDDFIVEFSIDGGMFMVAADLIQMDGMFPNQTVTQAIPNGNTLDIRVTLNTLADNERLFLDNVRVQQIPEPSTVLGTLAAVVLGAGFVWQRHKSSRQC